VDFQAFERAARVAFASIPDQYRAGVDGLSVRRERLPHPDLPDVFTLGHCATEEYVSDWGGPDTTRSQVVLFWGSFRALADRDPDFDWEDELWETLTHELRHHLESLAGEDDLEATDYAADERFKRDEGLEFDPWFYQSGEAFEGGFRVEADYYLEQLWDAADFERVSAIAFEWRGRQYRVPRPEALGDVHFVGVSGVEEEPARLELVLVRKRSWWEDARRLVGARLPVVMESVAVAERVVE
jgi:hypothetical protein